MQSIYLTTALTSHTYKHIRKDKDYAILIQIAMIVCKMLLLNSHVIIYLKNLIYYYYIVYVY